MPDTDSTPSRFFPADALDAPTHPAWAPIFKRLRFGTLAIDNPHVVVAVSPCTPDDLLRRVRDNATPIVCRPLLWTGRAEGEQPYYDVPGYGYRSVARLLWAWYSYGAPPEFVQVVHAPCDPYARNLPEVADYGCTGAASGRKSATTGAGSVFLWEDRWRKCVWPWCLRVEPRSHDIMNRAAWTEARKLNYVVETDIYISRGLHRL